MWGGRDPDGGPGHLALEPNPGAGRIIVDRDDAAAAREFGRRLRAPAVVPHWLPPLVTGRLLDALCGPPMSVQRLRDAVAGAVGYLWQAKERRHREPPWPAEAAATTVVALGGESRPPEVESHPGERPQPVAAPAAGPKPVLECVAVSFAPRSHWYRRPIGLLDPAQSAGPEHYWGPPWLRPHRPTVSLDDPRMRGRLAARTDHVYAARTLREAERWCAEGPADDEAHSGAS
ncbi:hypothetical protein DFJ74DRAFT_706332 [Hyaloraphidium curvatum]|nr:hypothetical protein DFJ74DRAFT_706332 [Hyaloraphidium curvatum]